MGEQSLANNQAAAYQTALQRAWEELALRQPVAVAAKSGAVLAENTAELSWQLPFFNQLVVVKAREKRLNWLRSAEPVTVYESLILLHYLLTADGTAPREEWLPYRDLPGGLVYYSNFLKRVNRPLQRAMDPCPQAFFTWLRQYPGKTANYGDFSYQLDVLPNVPVLLIYWLGDEEVAASLSVLFDKTAPCYLPMEDLVVLAEIMAHRWAKTFLAQKRENL